MALKVGMPNKDIEKGSSCVDTWGELMDSFHRMKVQMQTVLSRLSWRLGEMESPGDGWS